MDSHIKVAVMLVILLRGVHVNKLWILVSLNRVFGTESHYIFPFRYHLELCIEKKCCDTAGFEIATDTVAFAT